MSVLTPATESRWLAPLVRRKPASRVDQLAITFQPLTRPVLLRTRACTWTQVFAGVTAFQVGTSWVNVWPGCTHPEVQRDHDQRLPAKLLVPPGLLIVMEPFATRMPSRAPASKAAVVVNCRNVCWPRLAAVRRARSGVGGSVSSTTTTASTSRPRPSALRRNRGEARDALGHSRGQ